MFAESIKTNLPTELLRTLVTVCEFRSVTKAAQLLQLTQPAVLQQIKKLEIIIGSEIIDRQLAGVNLTETGVEILRSAQQLLSINDKIISESGRRGRPANRPARYSELVREKRAAQDRRGNSGMGSESSAAGLLRQLSERLAHAAYGISGHRVCLRRGKRHGRCKGQLGGGNRMGEGEQFHRLA